MCGISHCERKARGIPLLIRLILFFLLELFHIIQGKLNIMENPINIIQYVIVSETQNFVSARFKKIGAFCIICFLFQVLATIQFDDDSAAWRAEVYNIVADSMLTPKANIVYLMISQTWPELYFGFGLVAS